MRRPMYFYALLLSVLALVFPFSRVSAQDTPRLRTISVSGEAQVNVPPDEAILTLGIETRDQSFDVAKRQNDENLAKILALIKTYNIPTDQVHTDFIGIVPPYYSQSDSSNRPFYAVHKTLVVTLKDISKFDDVLTSAIALGVSDVRNIQFVTTELRKYKDQARSMAITAAKEKADAMAGQLGEKVGKPININEDQIGWYSYYNYFYSYYGYGYQQYGGYNQSANAVQNVAQAGGSSGNPGTGDSTVGPGQIAVTARVTVTFALAD
ncbi:MAG TPA: SIMPL domain-containing protein [Aggregatilineales bacterium]|nr:SIMPL domain-containing protein [Aggregatilineales bacterium]